MLSYLNIIIFLFSSILILNYSKRIQLSDDRELLTNSFDISGRCVANYFNLPVEQCLKRPTTSLIHNSTINTIEKNEIPENNSQIKILVIIVAFNSLNNIYLQSQISNYIKTINLELSYEIKVLIMTSESWSNEFYHNFTLINQHSRLTIDVMKYPIQVGIKLSIYHRKIIENMISDYDLFIYQEDDMEVLHHHISLYLKYHNNSDFTLNSNNQLLGFIRYETIEHSTEFHNNNMNIHRIHDSNDNYLFEYPPAKFMQICYHNEPFILDNVNPHQGMYILTKSEILKLQNKCNFFEHDMKGLLKERYIREYMSSISVSLYYFISLIIYIFIFIFIFIFQLYSDLSNCSIDKRINVLYS